jgi:hypothetical protein
MKGRTQNEVEDRVLRRIFELQRVEAKEFGYFIIFSLHQILMTYSNKSALV